MKVLIVGGGIGGLCAARACAHFGLRPVVLERSRDFGEVGAGLQVPPNATRVFRRLGLDVRIARDAVQPTALQMRLGRSGREVFTVTLGERAERRWGAPYLHLHRADYIDALRDGLGDVAEVRLGAGVNAVERTADGVRARLDDGSRVAGDVLVGADGIHSVVRESLFGPDCARFTGNVAWRATVPVKALGDGAPDPTACVWVGAGRHAVTYRLRRGALANFVGVVEQNAAPAEGWRERGSKADALSDFAGWHPTITRLLECADPDALFRWALYDRAPLPRWSDGRVTLLGDAAHPMLPFLAQGAAMATEDAWVLAEELSRHVDAPEAGLSAYQDRRLARTTRVQAASRANMRTFHRAGGRAQLATYGPMWLAGRAAPQIVRGRLDWLYAHDVTDG